MIPLGKIALITPFSDATLIMSTSYTGVTLDLFIVNLLSYPDPVARFHLRNGAILYQVNWLANTDPVGMKSSAGIRIDIFLCMHIFKKKKGSSFCLYNIVISGWQELW